MSVNNVLNRKMFNTTGTNNNVSARGTGITSGLADRFEDRLAEIQSLNLFPQQPKPRFLDIYGPSLQTFFGALASGRSDAPGKVGRATSSWSTKLIHGGLRYLENYEFRFKTKKPAGSDS